MDGNVSERMRAVLFDTPLTRSKRSHQWVGARGIYHRCLIDRLLDRKLLTLDIDRDPQGRTATISEEGRAALLAQ